MLIKLYSRLLARSARHQTPGKNFLLLPASPPAGQPPSSSVPLIPLCPPALNPCRCPAPLPATCPCVSHAYTTATSILGAVGAMGQRNCTGRTSKQHGSPRLPGAVPWARPPLRNLLTPCHTRPPVEPRAAAHTACHALFCPFCGQNPPGRLTAEFPSPAGHPRGWRETKARAEAEITHIVFHPLKSSLGIPAHLTATQTGWSYKRSQKPEGFLPAPQNCHC